MRVLTILLVAVGSAVVGAGLYSVIGTSSSNSSNHEIIKVSDISYENADNVVVVKAGDTFVTQKDILDARTQLPVEMQQTPIEQIYRVLAEQILNTKLIDDTAQKAVDMTSEEVQAPLREARNQIVRNIYLNNLVDSEVTEDKLKTSYKTLISDAPEVEQVRARHILVKEEQEAKDLIKSLKKDTDFAKLAQEKSIGPSATNGGDLGYFSKTDMVPAFAEAAFSLDNGDVSKEPVQTQFGWHIIKVEDKRIQPKPSFEEAKDVLSQRIRNEIIQGNLNSLREQADITYYNFDGSEINTLDQ